MWPWCHFDISGDWRYRWVKNFGSNSCEVSTKMRQMKQLGKKLMLCKVAAWVETLPDVTRTMWTNVNAEFTNVCWHKYTVLTIITISQNISAKVWFGVCQDDRIITLRTLVFGLQGRLNLDTHNSVQCWLLPAIFTQAKDAKCQYDNAHLFIIRNAPGSVRVHNWIYHSLSWDAFHTSERTLSEPDSDVPVHVSATTKSLPHRSNWMFSCVR